MYITFDEYTALYDSVEEKVFSRAAFDACRYMDKMTTGIDGVKKLQEFFPVSEYDAEAVKRCTAAVVNLLSQIQEAEKSASMVRGYIQTENGLQGKVVSSVSAGNESISYSAASSKTAVDAVVADPAAKNRLVFQTIREYLSGVNDANGVNLLYMGVYPRV